MPSVGYASSGQLIFWDELDDLVIYADMSQLMNTMISGNRTNCQMAMKSSILILINSLPHQLYRRRRIN
jgi:hypothetical protein